jgi:uncharacterized protein
LIRFNFERNVGSRPVWGEVRIPDAPPARTAILTIHGYRGFKDWGFWPLVCDRLTAAGHAVVSFNFSGSGVRPGDEDITDIEAFSHNTVSAQVDELSALVDAALDGDLLPRRPRAIGLLGHSGGGGTAILEAGARGKVDALVTWAAVSRFDRYSEETRNAWRDEGVVYLMNRRTGRQLPVLRDLLDDLEANRGRLDVLAHAARVRAPWLIVHGEEDLTVQPSEARALARASKDAWLQMIEGADHELGASHPWSDQPPRHLKQALDATIRHFARHLPAGP